MGDNLQLGFSFAAHRPAYANPTADAVASAIPSKVDEAFKAFCYVPYSALTTVVKLHVACGEEDFVVNAQGGLTAKELDRRGEKSLAMVDWYAAAKAAEACIKFHHGTMCAAALASHHKLMMDLS